MVKAKLKPLEEIFGMIRSYKKILTLSCGGCVSVCMAGGQREGMELTLELVEFFRQNRLDAEFTHYTMERQCNPEYLFDAEEIVREADCVISTACGAGVQYIAESHPSKPVFPALNTLFIGIDRDVGLYEERCRTCGDCKLGYTGGICPITRCSKSILNGPCGGTHFSDGSCEIDREIPCAWNDIFERLKSQGRLENILTVHPPSIWMDQAQRTMVQYGFEERYRKKE